MNPLIALLPNSSGLPDNIANAFDFILTKVNAFSFLLPVSTMLTCVGIAVVFEVTLLTVKLIVVGIRIVRGA